MGANAEARQGGAGGPWGDTRDIYIYDDSVSAFSHRLLKGGSTTGTSWMATLTAAPRRGWLAGPLPVVRVAERMLRKYVAAFDSCGA